MDHCHCQGASDCEPASCGSLHLSCQASLAKAAFAAGLACRTGSGTVGLDAATLLASSRSMMLIYAVVQGSGRKL